MPEYVSQLATVMQAQKSVFAIKDVRKSIRATYTFISVDKYLEISTYYLEIST